MCPGGWIVPAATDHDEVVVNGMSLSRRDSPFANSGMVCGVEPEDVASFAKEHGVLAGTDVAGDPVVIAHRLRRAGDKQEAVVREGHHGEVALEAAAGVEHRGVDHARGAGHRPGRQAQRGEVVRAQPLQHRPRIAALQQQLAE